MDGTAMPPPPDGKVGFGEPSAFPHTREPAHGPPRSPVRLAAKAMGVVVGVLLLVALFGSAVYNLYAYHSGTATTAKVEHFAPSCANIPLQGSIDTLVRTNPLTDFLGVDACRASWSVGGTASTGPLVGAGPLHDYTHLDVRVFAGRAYTSAIGTHALWWALGIAIPVLGFAVVMWWRGRTGRSNRGLIGRTLRSAAEFFGDDN
jgi:hypothetical protein